MAPSRTTKPFVVEVPRLLRERGMSIRALASEVGVSDGYLSRVLRRADYKTASGDLAGRVAVALGRPRDFLPEYREDFVIDAMRRDGRVRDALYDRLKGKS